MASEETKQINENNSSINHPLNPNPAAAAPTAPSATTTLPSYPEMILAAIEASNDKNGANKSTISKHIEETYGNLPPAHSTLLAHHLNRMKATGELIMLKNNYLKPDPDAPPRRGRGRPPKPKPTLPPGTILPPPRPRGRPPKTRDPLAPPPPPKKSTGTPSGSGRKRGRPPKLPRTGPAQTTGTVTAVSGGAPRGRGRPPKVKPAVTATVGA